MENFGVAKGDIFKSFPKEIPQLSIINYPLSIRASAREMAIWRQLGILWENLSDFHCVGEISMLQWGKLSKGDDFV